MTFSPMFVNERWRLLLPADRVLFHRERPRWEAPRLAHMRTRVEPGTVVYDVGAECGDFSALYQSWGATVIPIEPQPQYWPSIRQTFEANGFAPPPAWFAGFASDVTDLYPAMDTVRERLNDAEGHVAEQWPRCSRGDIAPDFGFRHLAQQADSTPQTRLDDFAERIDLAPDIIVLDIEGAEHAALVGCDRLLTTTRPLLYVSVHEPTMLAWYDRTLDDLCALMDGYGYAGELLGTNGEDYWCWSPVEREEDA